MNNTSILPQHNNTVSAGIKQWAPILITTYEHCKYFIVISCPFNFIARIERSSILLLKITPSSSHDLPLLCSESRVIRRPHIFKKLGFVLLTSEYD